MRAGAVEVGVGLVQLADAVVRGRRARRGACSLCSRTSRVARPRPIARVVRISRRMAPSALSAVAVGEHRVADQGEVGEQLVEVAVVAAGLVRGAVRRAGRGCAAGVRGRSESLSR